MTIAPQIVQAADDVGPNTGSVYYGDYTNDTAPLIRVSLGDQAAAGTSLVIADSGQTLAQTTLTAAQVSQGYAEVAVSGLGDAWHLLTATLKAPDGSTLAASPSFALGVATALPAAPVIVSADDNFGAVTGSLHDGARTDDATPTLHVTEAGLPAPPTGSPGHAPYGGPALLSGTVQLYENGHLVGSATLSYGGEVTITPGALSAGDHVLTAVAIDRAGNVSAPSDSFHLTIGADPVAAPAQPTEGDDMLTASAGMRDIFALAGNDTLVGAQVSDTLRGGQGDDSITGGGAYNEINGNQGQDTIVGRSHVGDSLMGGQGEDLIDARASAGHDSINGNMGDDAIWAGSAGAVLWGGQGDDVIHGGTGSDWLSGDRGQNTVWGGAGADVFHGMAQGQTRVMDFNAAEGDRVQIDPGVGWHVSQQGDDTLISLDGGGQLVLAGVQSASLSGAWIFQG